MIRWLLDFIYVFCGIALLVLAFVTTTVLAILVIAGGIVVINGCFR